MNDSYPPRRPRRHASLMAGGAALLLAATGCAATTDTESSANDPIELVSQLPEAGTDVDTITWNLTGGEPDTLDPANAVTYSSGQVVKNVCDSLLSLSPDFDLGPGLAEYEQVSPTQIVYTITPGAKFSDGTPVTAEDVAYSLNRTSQPDKVLSYIFMNVASVDVTGESEVTVTFAQPDELFNNEMANVSGVILKKAFAEAAGEDLGTPTGGLLCSGPFTLASWASGSGITLERNEEYWNSDLRPFARAVEFTFVTDATAVTQALAAGEIDGAYELPASAIPTLATSDAGSLYFGPSMQSTNLYVAQPDGPTADPRLREALQLLVDREGIAEAIYHGSATPLYTALTPATWPNAEASAYEDAYEDFVTARAFDIEGAKALVDESSYSGETLILAIEAGNETASKVAQLIQQTAEQAGVKVEIEALQPLVHSQAGYDAAAREGIDLYLSSSFNAAQDPLEVLGFNFLPGQPYNYTEYSDDTVTELLTTARQTFDGPERAEMVIEAQSIYEAANTEIPIVSNNTATFLASGLTGAVTSFAYWSMPQMAFIGGE